MYCRHCGKELPNDSNFCPNCGSKQEQGKRVAELQTKIVGFYCNHKGLSVVYVAWFLLHITLWIFSNPIHTHRYGLRGNYSSYDIDLSDAFYPFDKPLSDYANAKFSLLDNCDVYDFSEFFFYTVIIPFIIVGLYKLFLFFFSKMKRRSRVTWIVLYAIWSVIHVVLWVFPLTLKPFPFPQSNFYPFVQTYSSGTKIFFDKLEIYDYSEFLFYVFLVPFLILCFVLYKELFNKMKRKSNSNSKDPCSSIKSMQQISTEDLVETKEIRREPDVLLKEMSSKEKKIESMSIFKRFVGSIIDKVLILILFVVVSIIISPYGAPGRLGTYHGLLNSSPEVYEYVDRVAMNNYGTYYEGISKGYQDIARLESTPPHIGSTMELDVSITFSFILFNLLYYILFESILSASLGKRMLGGVILDSADDKIGFVKALLRAICGGVLMSGVYLLFHLQMELSNYVVIFVFFLLLDLPVFFTKRSLIDICTFTTYAKRGINS